jgi:hypothetical protein
MSTKTTTTTTTTTTTPQEQQPKLEYLRKSPSATATATAVKTFDNSPTTKSKAAGQYLPPPLENNFYDEINQNKGHTTEKLKRAMKSNPFVPLGCLVTIGVLVNGLIALKNKDKVKSQRMMRYRVAAQGTTIIALIAGTLVSTYFAKSSSE